MDVIHSHMPLARAAVTWGRSSANFITVHAREGGDTSKVVAIVLIFRIQYTCSGVRVLAIAPPTPLVSQSLNFEAKRRKGFPIADEAVFLVLGEFLGEFPR